TMSDVAPLRLGPVAPGLPSGAHATYRGRSGSNLAVLTAEALPALSDGSTYQAWASKIAVQRPKACHSCWLSAISEFRSWWSMADSNRRPLACQARAGAFSSCSAAYFEIDPRSSVCLLRPCSVGVIECLFEYHPPASRANSFVTF